LQPDLIVIHSLNRLLAVMMLALVAAPVAAQDFSGEEAWMSTPVYRSLEEALQHPDSVYKLDLHRKRYTSFPKDILRLPNLRILNLSRNRIAVIPPEIAELKKLNELDLSHNKLTQVPPALGSLTQLIVLNLNRNKITSLPPEMGDLVNLQTLEMWDNELDTVPDEFSNLKKLRKLELRGILFSDAQQERIRSLLPQARIYFSPSCACKE